MSDPNVLQQVNETETYITRRLWTGMKLTNYSKLSQSSADTDVHVGIKRQTLYAVVVCLRSRTACLRTETNQRHTVSAELWPKWWNWKSVNVEWIFEWNWQNRIFEWEFFPKNGQNDEKFKVHNTIRWWQVFLYLQDEWYTLMARMCEIMPHIICYIIYFIVYFIEVHSTAYIIAGMLFKGVRLTFASHKDNNCIIDHFGSSNVCYNSMD